MAWTCLAAVPLARTRPDAGTRAPGSATIPPAPADAEPIRQSKRALIVDLDVPAAVKDRVDERAARLSLLVTSLARHPRVRLDGPRVAVLIHLEATIDALAQDYMLEDLRITLRPALSFNRTLDLLPRSARAGLGWWGAVEVLAAGRLLDAAPKALVDTRAATGWTRSDLTDDTAAWELNAPGGQLSERAGPIPLVLLLSFHQERRTATLKVDVRGHACTAIMGQCMGPRTQLEGRGDLKLSLRKDEARAY